MPNILIWDSKHNPSTYGYDSIILWNNNSHEAINALPITRIIELYANQVKDIYLNWVHSLKSDICKSIPFYSTLSNNIDIWPASTIYEKHNLSANSCIPLILKCLAFSCWINDTYDDKARVNVYLETECLLLRSIFSDTQKSYSVLNHRTSSPFKTSINKIDSLPITRKFLYSFKSLSWLLGYCFIRFPILFLNIKRWASLPSSFIVLNYATVSSIFDQSLTDKFWASLPSALPAYSNSPLRFLHIYMPSNGLLPSIKLFFKLLAHNNGNNIHLDISSFVSLKVLKSTICDYFKILVSNTHVPRFKILEFDFYPLLLEEYINSLFGKQAIHSILLSHLFDTAFRASPPSILFLYLSEGFGWESLALQAFHNNHSGRSVAYPHSTTRFWDLKLFDNSLRQPLDDTLLQDIRLSADIIASSGPLSDQIWTSFGIHPSRVIRVESLRYLHLVRRVDSLAHKPFSTIGNSHIKPTILFFGDFYDNYTRSMISAVSKLYSLSGGTYTFLFKPHPSSTASTLSFVKQSIPFVEISYLPLSSLRPLYKLAIVPANSSVILDCLFMGFKVCLFHDEQFLNNSPLRSSSFVHYARSADDLLLFCQTFIDEASDHQFDATKIFNCDLSLPLWRRFLTKFE